MPCGASAFLPSPQLVGTPACVGEGSGVRGYCTLISTVAVANLGVLARTVITPFVFVALT